MNRFTTLAYLPCSRGAVIHVYCETSKEWAQHPVVGWRFGILEDYEIVAPITVGLDAEQFLNFDSKAIAIQWDGVPGIFPWLEETRQAPFDSLDAWKQWVIA